jgi:dipeptidyl aminopeptidase/acylaminoacyl peptidase
MLYAVTHDAKIGFMPLTRIVAVDADGENFKLLSTQANDYTWGYLLQGGQIIDWLPDEDGAVLMTRMYLPDAHLGSRQGSTDEGLGVDRIDTRTLKVSHVEPANPSAIEYLTDGRGVVRILATEALTGDGRETGVVKFSYRESGNRSWRPLSNYDTGDRGGFRPVAVDHDLNVAYGFKKLDGRFALYSIALDGSLREQLIFSRPDVDVDSLIRVGRRQRVVGVSYATEARVANYFDPKTASLMKALSQALPPDQTLSISGASLDEGKLSIFSSSDVDPGVYYIFDRKSHNLTTFLVARAQLEGIKLAKVAPVTYTASDGTSIPAYLTLPPGREQAKRLPAIVLPHGGPSARDEGEFDWLPQYYASQGYAVLQPNFRGSSGYGDAWFQDNGFRSWSVAIGDVLAAGRWLVNEGIADPDKLAIVGWSYGGYAALQAAVVDPNVFKAIVAIAPVTDLAALKEEHRNWSDYSVVSDFVGQGPHLSEGSPLEHADKIKSPVLLFHGALDVNVSINESKRMAARLNATGNKCELITWEKLDHQLDDSEARAQMLRSSEAFLRKAFGL